MEGRQRCVKEFQSTSFEAFDQTARGGALLELNNAVPVRTGRGHWKAVDFISFPILQCYTYCLPWLFLNICLYLFLVEILSKKFFSFLRTPVSESDNSQRLGFGFSFVCEEVFFIINSVVYGFIIEQFMWIFSVTY